jgi:hypothetical protein
MKWQFLEQTPGHPTRDPIIGEFFSTDAIDNPAQALVREGIQNALDAKRDQSIRVRLLLVDNIHAPVADGLSRWFDGAWSHLRSPKNGLQEVPANQEPCAYLVFEDFGTSGLTGDEAQAFDVEGINNSFFYFFRAEGRSAKNEGDRGRWGVGKHVFPRSSRVSTYFGLTVRIDDGKNLLMGHTVLKSHLLDGVHYSPDGYLGEPSSGTAFMLPISDSQIIDDFRQDFRISRDQEPGLSIVVPFVDSEITVEYLKEAVISDYFYPILKGELVVEIADSDRTLRIDTANLLAQATSLRGALQNKIIPLLRLADWAAFRSDSNLYVLNPCILEEPAWSDDLIPADRIESMRTDLDNARDMALHVGLRVQQKGHPPTMSFLTVYLCHDEYEGGRPVFIREGITISDVRAPRSRNVRSLVVVDDKPLATLLGDSENPAHTQWQKDSSHFKNKYVNGRKYIEFVTRIVFNIVNALGAQENERDPNLFADVFSLPLEHVDGQPPMPTDVPQPKSGNKSGHTPINLPRREQIVRVARIAGGFKILPGDATVTPPARLDIQVAYDVRRGNPIAKYDRADFLLDQSPINFRDSLRGVEVLAVDGNSLMIDIQEPDFEITVSGFDERRDLFIKTKVVEVQYDTKA